MAFNTEFFTFKGTFIYIFKYDNTYLNKIMILIIKNGEMDRLKKL
jgi:hypothetical protein